MNKIVKGLLVTVLAVSAARASDYTNKTFLMPRPQGVNLPMEYTTFAELIGTKDDDKFGGNLAVTGFYQDSTNGSDIAKYFLTKNKSTLTMSAAVSSDNKRPDNDGSDLDAFYIVHSAGITTAGLGTTTIGLDPEAMSYGVRFDYHQDLSKILKGLYLKIALPVVYTENDPGLKVASTVKTSADDVKANFEDYFKGNFERLTTGATALNAQAKLTHAKIAGKQSDTGVADLDIALGYKFLNKEKYHAALAIAVTIPTGTESKGIYLFEPIIGNGKHFGLGGDFCAGARVWGDMDQNIKLYLNAKYRYLFENTQKRTLGLKDRFMGQYFLLTTDPKEANTQAIPAANITTLNLDVTPGSQFDGVLGMAYNNGGFSFDLGYNMYFREAESAKLKDAFANNKYAVVGRDKDMKDAGRGGDALTKADVDGDDLAFAHLTTDKLDLASAETPSQFTHGIYGGLGYIFKEWDTPVMFGVGGKYELPSKNSALEQWGVWGKLGIGF